jgi:hypothetical protein
LPAALDLNKAGPDLRRHTRGSSNKPTQKSPASATSRGKFRHRNGRQGAHVRWKRIKEALEVSSRLRGSEDRRLLDAVMLWAAREIGIDFDAEATFNEDPISTRSRDQDRVDGLVAAISAAAHAGAPDPISELPIRPWADAPRLGAGWMDRHIALGTAFQAQLRCDVLPTLRRPVATRDIVVWPKEPHFPRLVADLGPKRASLLEPGHQTGSEPLKVHPDFLRALDLARIRAEAATLYRRLSAG